MHVDLSDATYLTGQLEVDMRSFRDVETFGQSRTDLYAVSAAAGLACHCCMFDGSSCKQASIKGIDRNPCFTCMLQYAVALTYDHPERDHASVAS